MNASKHQKNRNTASSIFVRADKLWNQGKLELAFSLFMEAAKAGDVGAEQNVGYFYDLGLGVRRNRKKALHWYTRAYRKGDASSAKNIGTVWRDLGNPRRALSWFRRAVKMGDDDANLEIAKYHLHRNRTPTKAIPFLENVRQSTKVSESSMEEAERLLKEVQARE
ncbi:MAG: tetratricopeptide repeat protein [Terriglobales bacterium]